MIKECSYDDKYCKRKTDPEQAYESEKLSTLENSEGDFEIVF